MRWHKMSETSRMNISGLPFPTPYPHIHSVSSSTVSCVKQGNGDTPESWLLRSEMALRDVFQHCEEFLKEKKKTTRITIRMSSW